jgi:hypothetical protein
VKIVRLVGWQLNSWLPGCSNPIQIASRQTLSGIAYSRNFLMPTLAHILSRNGHKKSSSSMKRGRHTCGERRKSAERFNAAVSHSLQRPLYGSDAYRYIIHSYNITKEK